MDLAGFKKIYIHKMTAQKISWEELSEVMDFMTQVANTNDDFQEDYADFVKTYQFSVSDKPEKEWMWLKCDKGKFSSGKGKLAKADLTFIMNSILACGMISGAVDSNSAFLKGELKIVGNVKDGVKFQGIMALFKDALDI